MVNARRWGVFGGTFNPIHLGHLLAAEEARSALALDAVVFVPAGDPWMRVGERLESRDDRWKMVELAIASNPAFRANRMELDRPGLSYTVDTIEKLAAEVRGEYYFILGADALAGVPKWKDPGRLLKLCHMIGVTRPGSGGLGETRRAIEEAVPQAKGRIEEVPGLAIDISATDIRRRVAAGRSIRYRVPEAVESYIMTRGLYKRAEG